MGFEGFFFFSQPTPSSDILVTSNKKKRRSDESLTPQMAKRSTKGRNFNGNIFEVFVFMRKLFNFLI